MTLTPFAHPAYVMLKPIGSACNLSCSYCYYLEKQKLHGQPRPMSMELLEKFTRQYIAMQTMPEVLFTWHGGEPLLLPVSFYEQALRLQRRYGRGRPIDNCIQTNGTLLNDEWCRFLKSNNFLVGLSIDGPQQLHDHFRQSAAGTGSWQQTMRAVDLLNRHGVEWNAMATVNSVTAMEPTAFYRFFRDIGCHYLQFTPVVERRVRRSDGLTLAAGNEPIGSDAELTPFSVSAEAWGEFLCTVYDEWVRHDVGELFVQTFDATLANWAGVTPGVCSLSEECGHVTVMEADGTLYSCDHFVFPEHRLGNLREQPLTSMVYGRKQAAFAWAKRKALPRQCLECKFLFACHGECPRNRFINDCYGERGLNYLCRGYRRFFEHVAADMDFMLGELQAGRAPRNVMARHGSAPLAYPAGTVEGASKESMDRK